MGICRRVFEKNPTSIIEEYDGIKYNYKELLELINTYGSFSDSLSYKGCKCIVICRKSIESLKALLFCWRIGMIAVPMSLHYGIEQCQKIIKVIQPEFILSDDESINLYNELPIYTIQNFLKQSIYSAVNDIVDVELMMCTSGTTGMPKASMFTGTAIKTNVLAISDYFPITNRDKILIARPLYHCAVLVGEALTALNNGASIIFYSNEYNPIVLSRILEKEKITVMCGTPTIFKGLADCLRFRKKVGELQVIALSGEYLIDEYAKYIEKIFNKARIFNVYGLTEAGPRVSYLMSGKFSSIPQSVGVPLNGVEIMIVKDSKGNNKEYIVAGNGEVGKVWVNTPSLMIGYYRDEKNTEEHIHGKWFDTGDMGYINDGFLYIVGRSDDMIIKSGVNIYPREIECKILELDEVKDVLVYGMIIDDVEQIVADIILEEQFIMLDLINLKKIISKQVQSYMMPYVINIVKDFKRNASGKVVRPSKKLRTLHFDEE